ncbi:MAG: tetratricopeptide repeat protein, partial [Candidatus Contendobacter sp.]|nr:tetratricopeptide repeat protein [Candidatus Contendobacter sp.]
MIDPQSIDLGPEAENAWLRLRHHLDWSQGFALGFLFVANPRLADAFRWRLERAYQGRVSTLQTLQPTTPEAALDAVMHHVRESPALLDDMAAPLWIELHEHAGDEAWDRARTLVLARLNEHRELLRQRLRRPLILILPQGWQAQARQIAPDLWFIRDFSLEVAATTIAIAHEILTVAKSPLVATEPSKSWWRQLLDKLSHPFRPRLADHPLVAEWRRVRRKGGDDPNVLNVGWRAIKFLLDQRRVEEAYAIANEVLALARRGSESDPRSLSVALDWVGDAASALGRLEEAERAYAESLAVMRDLRQRLGETPEVLRDLSVSLDRVGDAASALGRLEEAERAYAESLAV